MNEELEQKDGKLGEVKTGAATRKRLKDGIPNLLERIAAGEKLASIGKSLDRSKPTVYYHAKRQNDYKQVKLQAIEERAKQLSNIKRGRDREKHLRYLRRSLKAIEGIRYVAIGLFRGPCKACGSRNGVYARTALGGGVAECIDCAWQGRADVYVLGRKSNALHIAYGPQEKGDKT